MGGKRGGNEKKRDCGGTPEWSKPRQEVLRQLQYRNWYLMRLGVRGAYQCTRWI